MFKTFLTAAAALSLAGCASTHADGAPVCDGKHLRPANPYGTVLAPAVAQDAPASPSAAASGAPAPPAPGATFGSCGS